jgi:RHS repeat-associated protein
MNLQDIPEFSTKNAKMRWNYDGEGRVTNKVDTASAEMFRYQYDPAGRLTNRWQAGGTTTYTFNDADQVVTLTTPAPGTGQAAQTTTMYYDNSGRATGQLLADNTTTTNLYYVTGQLKRTSGSRAYPVGYGYDAQGRMKTMTNWSTFSASSGARVTTWNYDPYRGFLSSKTYDGGTPGPSYTYTGAGRLLTRLWARGTNTTYSYNNAGDLSGVSYNDGVTPNVTYTYDRRGRQATVLRNGMTTTVAYNDAGQLLMETNSGGTLNGLSVTNGYDICLRRTNVTVLNPVSSILNRAAYTYDNASRLQTVSDGTNNATYTYLANSPLVSQIAVKSNTVSRMTAIKSYDYLNRLTTISSAPSASSAVSFSYVYNNANQRTRRSDSDTSYWVYQYDSLGQVTSGKKYLGDGTPVPGQQFEYGSDDIGNRTSTKAGGDSSGSSASLRSASYTANTLNQYTSRDVPNAFDVLGASHATNTVTVNGSAADYRRGEYFQELVTVVNSSTSVWQTVNVTNSGGGSITGSVFVAKTPETFGHDKDGNLTNDGRWVLTWDAENRLVQMESRTDAPTGSKLKLRFGYDAQGRRISKTVSNWVSGAWQLQSTNRFVYDGWNLLAEVGASGSLVRGYVWGLDLSGSVQGAGGVGGLLEVTYCGAQTTNCFVAFDGNGNVAALVNAANSNVVAQYEYGPFGEPLRATGPMAKANPFRFSTRFTDDETDLLYCGYRFYNQNLGRWPSRDMIEEVGGAACLCLCP